MENIINNNDKILLGIGAGVLVLLFVFLYLWIQTKKRLKQLEQTLEEKEEKIQWFRKIEAENERKRVALAHEVEVERLALNSSIEKLEKEANEGTKNQVITKINAQQTKRERLLKRAGLSE